MVLSNNASALVTEEQIIIAEDRTHQENDRQQGLLELRKMPFFSDLIYFF